MTINLDLDETVKVVDKVIADAAREGVHSYEESFAGCWYVHRFTSEGIRTEGFGGNIVRREPGCIIGRLAIELGVPIEHILIEDEGYFRTSRLRSKMKNTYGIHFSGDALSFLSALQDLQDKGKPWVEARNIALDSIKDGIL
jgi:hypothetical protein